MVPAMFNQHEHWGPFWEGGLRIGDWRLGSKREGAPSLEDFLADRWGAEPRLAEMDKAGVDKFVFTMPFHMVMYHTDPVFAAQFATAVNDGLAEYCAAAPDRFYFWAHVPMQDPVAAAKEAERAITQLGAKGVSMGGSNFGGGVEADDPALYPVWEKAAELDVPIFVHGYNQSVNWGAKAMDDRYDTTSIVGMNSDETLFYWYLTNGGVLDDFPDLKILITHGGGFVPFQLGRFAATNVTMAPDSKNKKPLGEYNKNFYYDLDIESAIMRRAIVDEVGVEHVLYGSNFGGADTHGNLTDGMNLPEDDLEKIRSGNTLKMMSF
jgi:aminocarboxymuconate-semialdehyde decarboxylase